MCRLNAFIRLVTAAVLLSAPTPSHASGSVPDDLGVTHVIQIVMDGLRSDYLPRGGPNFTRLLTEGACSLNSRNDWATSQTLPNHIGMFTGLIVDQHGYHADKDGGGMLVDGNGVSFENIFDLVAAAGGKTGFYGSKLKFAMFQRSWNINHYEMQLRAKQLVPIYLEDMNREMYNFSFLHIRSADRAGHKDAGEGLGGAYKPLYLEAVQEADKYLGQVLELIEQNAELRGRTAVVVTADHGFADYGNHGDEEMLENFRIPFCVIGPGVTPGADLAEINASSNGGIIVDPGVSRGEAYDPVIRNSYSAVLAADFLGIHTSSGPFSNQYLAVGGRDQPLQAEDVVPFVPVEIVPAAPPTSFQITNGTDMVPFVPVEIVPAAPPTSFQITEGKFQITNGTFVGCIWAVKKPELAENRCDRTTFDGDVVKNICPTECANYSGASPEFEFELVTPPAEEETTIEEPTPDIVSPEEMLLAASEHISIAEYLPDAPYPSPESIIIGEGIDALILFKFPQELDDTTIGPSVLELRVLSGKDKFKDAMVYQVEGNWMDQWDSLGSMGWDSAPAADTELGKLQEWENPEGDIYATVELSRDELNIVDGRLLLRIEPKKKDMVAFDPNAKLAVKYTK